MLWLSRGGHQCRLAWAALAALPIAAYATPATDAAARLADIERQRTLQTQAHATASRDLAGAQAQAARLAAASAQQTAALRQTESRVLAATARLAALQTRVRTANTALAAAQRDFDTLLPTLLRLARTPELAILAAPIRPAQAIQGLLVTRTLAIVLNRQAAELRASQTEADAARLALTAQAVTLTQARSEQSARAAALDRVVAQAQTQVTQAETEARDAATNAATAAAQAKTLREAIATINEAQARAEARAAADAATATRHHKPADAQTAHARQAALARPTSPQSAASLTPPVAGQISRAYAAPTDDGPATGITYATAPDAYVSSPCAGRVAFAAPFRSYGQLLILECAGGYDVVLAGLGKIATHPGHPTQPASPWAKCPPKTPASTWN